MALSKESKTFAPQPRVRDLLAEQEAVAELDLARYEAAADALTAAIRSCDQELTATISALRSSSSMTPSRAVSAAGRRRREDPTTAEASCASMASTSSKASTERNAAADLQALVCETNQLRQALRNRAQAGRTDEASDGSSDSEFPPDCARAVRDARGKIVEIHVTLKAKETREAYLKAKRFEEEWNAAVEVELARRAEIARREGIVEKQPRESRRTSREAPRRRLSADSRKKSGAGSSSGDSAAVAAGSSELGAACDEARAEAPRRRRSFDSHKKRGASSSRVDSAAAASGSSELAATSAEALAEAPCLCPIPGVCSQGALSRADFADAFGAAAGGLPEFSIVPEAAGSTGSACRQSEHGLSREDLAADLGAGAHQTSEPPAKSSGASTEAAGSVRSAGQASEQHPSREDLAAATGAATPQAAESLAGSGDVSAEAPQRSDDSTSDSESGSGALPSSSSSSSQPSSEAPSLAEAATEEDQVSKRKASVAVFLKEHGYSGVSECRRRVLRKAKYPIHTAAKNGDWQMVKMLLEEGADPRVKTSQGKTAAQIAREKDRAGSHIAVLRVLGALPALGGA